MRDIELQIHNNVGRRLTLLCLIGGMVSALFAAIAYTGFDGVYISGLNQFVGDTRSGSLFYQSITIHNIALDPVKVKVMPTCGCAFDGPISIAVPPLSARSVKIRYRVRSNSALPELMSRKAIISYKIGNAKARVTRASVSFRLRPFIK